MRVSGEDDGVGIPKGQLLKMFDPYFSTQLEDSSLDLATAYSIIQRHAGYARGRSEVGAGTCRDVYLPASAHSLTAVVEAPARPASGGGHLLVMADEQIVQDLAAQLRAHLGCQVATVADAEQAVACYREALERGEHFDAVLLDLTIVGGMGGRECVRRLRQLDPSVRAVVSSGSLVEVWQQGFDPIIEEPYDWAVLARTLGLAVGSGRALGDAV